MRHSTISPPPHTHLPLPSQDHIITSNHFTSNHPAASGVLDRLRSVLGRCRVGLGSAADRCQISCGFSGRLRVGVGSVVGSWVSLGSAAGRSRVGVGSAAGRLGVLSGRRRPCACMLRRWRPVRLIARLVGAGAERREVTPSPRQRAEQWQWKKDSVLRTVCGELRMVDYGRKVEFPVWSTGFGWRKRRGEAAVARDGAQTEVPRQ